MNRAVLSLFLSRLFADRSVWGLPVAAFAVVTALTLGVAGGVHYFFTLQLPEAGVAGMYRLLSGFALVLLLFPLTSLAGSAARLLARRRDERLSSLRLLGASTGTITGLAVAEATVLAAAGAVVGLAGWALLAPAIALLPFAGGRVGLAGQWLGIPLTLGVLVAVVLLGALSALLGLRRVAVTPLGVRTRQRPRGVVWVRALVAVGVLVAAQAAASVMGLAQSEAVMIALAVAALAAPLIAVQAIGPWVLGLTARRRVRRARTAERLVAARLVLEDPRLAWRQVGGVALTVYIGTVGAAGFGMAEAFQGDGAAVTASERHLIADLGTGVLVTMVVSFLLAACSVAISQAAQLLDRADLHGGLVMAGMDVHTVHAMRRRAVMSALGTVLVFSLAAALASAAPVIGAAAVFAPVSLLTAAACLALGVLLVRGGVELTRPALRRSLTGQGLAA